MKLKSFFHSMIFVGLIGFVLTPLHSAQAAPYFATNAEATKAATKIGYVKTNQLSNGQPVYKANQPASSVIKGLIYITPDADSHNGGAWKGARTVSNLASKNTRLGTYNESLTIRIGD